MITMKDYYERGPLFKSTWIFFTNIKDVLCRDHIKLTCGTGETDENVKTLQTNGQTDGLKDWWAKAERKREWGRERAEMVNTRLKGELYRKI